MILEHALLPVLPGREAEFEDALVEALPVIRSMPGCLRAEVTRCQEQPSTYLLLVEWETLQHHTEGFRGSPDYLEWKRLLHHFYDPFPTVWHFEPIPRLAGARP